MNPKKGYFHTHDWAKAKKNPDTKRADWTHIKAWYRLTDTESDQCTGVIIIQLGEE